MTAVACSRPPKVCSIGVGKQMTMKPRLQAAPIAQLFELRVTVFLASLVALPYDRRVPRSHPALGCKGEGHPLTKRQYRLSALHGR